MLMAATLIPPPGNVDPILFGGDERFYGMARLTPPEALG